MPLSGFRYIYVADDSGDFSPPFAIERGHVRIKLPASRWAVLGALRFNDAAIPDFTAEWIRLQLSIQQKLRLPYLPAIHMRLMWGKDSNRRPPCYKGKSPCKTPNPYLRADPDAVYQWVLDALKLLQKYQRAKTLQIEPKALDATEYAESLAASTWLIQELERIISATGKKATLRFLKVLYSPYTILLSDLIADIQVHLNSKRSAVILDNTSDVAGFDVHEDLLIVHTKQPISVKVIGRIDTLGFDANQFALLQASDVVAYFYRKSLEGDPVSKNFVHNYLGVNPPKISRPSGLRWRRKEIAKYNMHKLMQLTQRFAHAYKLASSRDQRGCFSQLVVSPEEFAKRLEAYHTDKRPIRALQVSLLKKPLSGREPVYAVYYDRRGR